ncbi:MAG: hypothetical protein EXQ88_07310 [Alphaproteobacteria bacterium]|nr:hypothetical protein [Alphaproteobacteria bacterium]
MRRILLPLLLLLAAAPAAQAQTPAPATGRANVIDGDLLAIGRQRYRIFGIDAIEPHQYCYLDGKAWACGAVATRTLEVMASLEPVTCREVAIPADGQNLWAECTVGGKDIGEAMVRAGFALANRAQTDKYVPFEDAAKAIGLQIWKSAFVAPWIYRADLRAIEDRVAERLFTTVQKDIERALTEGQGGIEVLQGFKIGRTSRPWSVREFSVEDLGANFITRAVPNDHAFNWQDPAMATIRWRQMVVLRARAFADRQIWSALGELPKIEVTTPDVVAFLTEIIERSKPWVKAGRKPILFVRGAGDPPWIGELLGGAPMPGLNLSRNEENRSSVYLFTVNGVDIYRGALPEGEALLFPADILSAINYRVDAGGRMITVDHQPGTEATAPMAVMRYALELLWKSDEVISLRYPYRPPAAEYE